MKKRGDKHLIWIRPREHFTSRGLPYGYEKKTMAKRGSK
jgi:hypothetical protein